MLPVILCIRHTALLKQPDKAFSIDIHTSCNIRFWSVIIYPLICKRHTGGILSLRLDNNIVIAYFKQLRFDQIRNSTRIVDRCAFKSQIRVKAAEEIEQLCNQHGNPFSDLRSLSISSEKIIAFRLHPVRTSQWEYRTKIQYVPPQDRQGY